jgi:hypothetical protein
MARWADDEDEDRDPADDGEGEPTVPCQYCRREMHEDSPRCPHCGNYVSREDAPTSRKPWWIIIGGLAALYAVYRWVVG